MANGYLQSVGIGQFTPKEDNIPSSSKYSSAGPTHAPSNTQKLASERTTTWKKSSGDDGFNFD